jgi:hypothetical protein
MQDSFSVQHATSGIRDGMIDQTKSMLQKSEENLYPYKVAGVVEGTIYSNSAGSAQVLLWELQHRPCRCRCLGVWLWLLFKVLFTQKSMPTIFFYFLKIIFEISTSK